MYHFEKRVKHRDRCYDFSGMMYATIDSIIEGCVTCHKKCIDNYVPHGTQTQRNRVCIARLDMYYYTWHGILLHCKYLWTCECLYVEPVIEV